MESETRPTAQRHTAVVKVYFDRDMRVVEGDDPGVMFARRITFDDGVIVKAEFLKVTPPGSTA